MSTAYSDAVQVSVPRAHAIGGALGDLPPRILGFIRESKRLSRSVHKAADSERRNILRADMINLDRIIRDSIRILKGNRFKDFLGGYM